MTDEEILASYEAGYVEADVSRVSSPECHDYTLRCMEERHMAGLRRIARDAAI
ncbi:hypothetical protein SEA_BRUTONGASTER_66 [Gordonia phage BrutonGaster]|uniref:Uncharacterized protein n=1 Tax=Gordonia phage BrutonGaster TaxID=2530116 RepID=A0A482JKI8_9CAUD|nr:hypothetical protein HOV26_gp116 [Gordonia phage BrutonGaster]QBP33283.1 hypothetical protein SEA_BRUTONGASTER_66 [Gordonia phage BrutonGaster]